MSKHKETYIQIHEQIDNLPLFFKPWFLDAVCGGKKEWDVCISYNKDNQIQGVLPFYKSRKYGITHITMPLLAPYLGPWIIYPDNIQKPPTKISFEKKTISDLLRQMPNFSLIKIHCHPSLSNVLPVHWAGYDALTRYTYILHKKEEKTLWKDLDAKQRNIILKAQEKFKITESEDIKNFFTLNKMSFDRTGENMPYDENYLTSVYQALSQKKSTKLWYCEDKMGNTHAGIFLAFDAESTYCLAIGNDPKYKNSGGLSLLMWECILSSFKVNNQFNFEGGMIPNIETFFRSYGGQLTTYYRIQKSRNLFLKGLFTWMGKI